MKSRTFWEHKGNRGTFDDIRRVQKDPQSAKDLKKRAVIMKIC